jgi:DNA-binding FrmR family transcriptional regulator
MIVLEQRSAMPSKKSPVVAAHAVSDPEALKEITLRLKRAQGQIGGIVAMLEEGRSCQDIVTQMAAVSKAIDRAAFSLISTGLRECIAENDGDVDSVSAQLEKLFLTMA